jgi:hypothetical protein
MALSRRVLFFMATNTAVELLRRQSTCAFARFCCSDCIFGCHPLSRSVIDSRVAW